jgi:hypothetical protein
MVIKRTVNGEEMEFKLTLEELMHAYYEQERNYDKEDAQQRMHEMFDQNDKDEDEAWVGRTKITVGDLRKVADDDEALDFIAESARERMSGYDPYLEALWECVEDGIEEYFTDEYPGRVETANGVAK